MEKWELLGVLIHMSGVAHEMIAKHRIGANHGDLMKSMTRLDAWNALDDKLHDKWRRLYEEVEL